jgi:hypothetical protein
LAVGQKVSVVAEISGEETMQGINVTVIEELAAQ